jgi:hypothetical protein
VRVFWSLTARNRKPIAKPQRRSTPELLSCHIIHYYYLLYIYTYYTYLVGLMTWSGGYGGTSNSRVDRRSSLSSVVSKPIIVVITGDSSISSSSSISSHPFVTAAPFLSPIPNNSSSSYYHLIIIIIIIIIFIIFIWFHRHLLARRPSWPACFDAM